MVDVCSFCLFCNGDLGFCSSCVLESLRTQCFIVLDCFGIKCYFLHIDNAKCGNSGFAFFVIFPYNAFGVHLQGHGNIRVVLKKNRLFFHFKQSFHSKIGQGMMNTIFHEHKKRGDERKRHWCFVDFVQSQ